MFTLAASAVPRRSARCRWAYTASIGGNTSSVVPPPRYMGSDRHAVTGFTSPRSARKSKRPACRPRAKWSRCGLVLYEITARAPRTRSSVRLACRSWVTITGAPPLARVAVSMKRLSGSRRSLTPMAPCRARYTASTRPAAFRLASRRSFSVSKHGRVRGPEATAQAEKSGTGSASSPSARAARKPASSTRRNMPGTS